MSVEFNIEGLDEVQEKLKRLTIPPSRTNAAKRQLYVMQLGPMQKILMIRKQPKRSGKILRLLPVRREIQMKW